MKKIFNAFVFILVCCHSYSSPKDDELRIDTLSDKEIFEIVKKGLNKKSEGLTVITIINKIPLKITDTTFTQLYPGILRTIRFYYSANIYIDLYIDYSKVKYDKKLSEIPFNLTNYFNHVISCMKLYENKEQKKKYGVCKKNEYRRK